MRPNFPSSPAPSGDVFADEVTKTLCPACKGSTFESIEATKHPGRYRVVQCGYCEGAGMVTAPRASQWRMRRVVPVAEG